MTRSLKTSPLFTLHGMAEKPGPKPRPPQDRQATQLQICINVRDKAALAAAAKRAGLSLTANIQGSAATP